jgi:hypothetical protein
MVINPLPRYVDAADSTATPSETRRSYSARRRRGVFCPNILISQIKELYVGSDSYRLMTMLKVRGMGLREVRSVEID